jgi:serine/threonine protein kinase
MESECPGIETILSLDSEELDGNVVKYGDYVVKPFSLTQKVYRDTFTREKTAWLNAYSIPELRTILPPFCYIYETDTKAYLVQKYIPVETLRNILVNAKKSPLSVETTLSLIDAIESVFHKFWSTGFTHNDIKPENLLITIDSKKPIIIDIETMTSILPSSEPRPSALFGTHGYYPNNWNPPTTRIPKFIKTNHGKHRKRIKTSSTILDPYYTTVSDSYALAKIFEELLAVTDWDGYQDSKLQLKEKVQRLRYTMAASLVAQTARNRSLKSTRRRKERKYTQKTRK